MKDSVVALACYCFVSACSSSTPPATTNGTPGDSGGPDGIASADTWVGYAAGFFHTYCTSCHSAQDSTGRDYTIEANVAKEKDVMRCGVTATQDPAWNCGASPVARQFPIGSGPKPSDAERARIVAWIDAGEP
jgi:hypothetical protein